MLSAGASGGGVCRLGWGDLGIGLRGGDKAVGYVWVEPLMEEGEGGVGGLVRRRVDGPDSSASISDGSMIRRETDGGDGLESHAGGAEESPMSGI